MTRPRCIQERIGVGRGRNEAQPLLPDRGPWLFRGPDRFEANRLCLEVVPKAVGADGFSRDQLGQAQQFVGAGDLGRDCLVVLEAFAAGCRPHHGVEHRTAVLGHLDTLGRRCPALSPRLDVDIDRPESGDAQVVAREGRRQRVAAGATCSAQRAGCDVAAHRTPDLPVLAQDRPERTLACLLERGVLVKIAHRPQPRVTCREPLRRSARWPSNVLRLQLRRNAGCRGRRIRDAPGRSRWCGRLLLR